MRSPAVATTNSLSSRPFWFFLLSVVAFAGSAHCLKDLPAPVCETCKVGAASACCGNECVCVVFVRQGAASAQRNGNSWNEAMSNMQQAIDSASATPHCQVWVAAGRYHIYENSAADTVQLIPNVEVYGAIYVKTDCKRLITAFKIESESDTKKWFYFEYTLDSNGVLTLT